MTEQHQQGETTPGDLSAAELDRQLRRRLGRERPTLTEDEIVALKTIADVLTPALIETLQSVSKDYEFRRVASEKLHKNWPQLTFVLGGVGWALWSAYGWLQGVVASIKGHP